MLIMRKKKLLYYPVANLCNLLYSAYTQQFRRMSKTITADYFAWWLSESLKNANSDPFVIVKQLTRVNECVRDQTPALVET